MDFLPLLRAFLTLVMVLAFLLGLVWVIHYEFHHLLQTLSRVLKLEFRDRIGNICLAGLILFIALFLICLVSDKAFKLAASFLQPDLVQHSINLNMLIVLIVCTFVFNLVILGFLEGKRRKR